MWWHFYIGLHLGQCRPFTSYIASCPVCFFNHCILTILISITKITLPSAIDRCETFCDERGCHCLTDQDRPFSLIDHLIVKARNGGRIACFCGSFAVSIINHLLTYINLLLTYVVPFFNVTRVVRFQFLEQCINKDTFATAVG